MNQLRNLLDALDLKIIVTTLVAITCFSNSLLATCIEEGNPNDKSSKFELSIVDYLMQAVENNERMQLDLFVMSQCPYGVEAGKIIIPIVKQYPDIFDLNIYYIADEPKPGEFESLHGQTELDENIRQLIIQRLYPDQYYDYLLLRAENYNTKDWKVAGSYLGFDINKIQRISETDESKSLLRNNIRIGKNQSIYASPTLMVNGKEFEGNIFNKDYFNKLNSCTDEMLDEHNSAASYTNALFSLSLIGLTCPPCTNDKKNMEDAKKAKDDYYDDEYEPAKKEKNRLYDKKLKAEIKNDNLSSIDRQATTNWKIVNNLKQSGQEYDERLLRNLRVARDEAYDNYHWHTFNTLAKAKKEYYDYLPTYREKLAELRRLRLEYDKAKSDHNACLNRDISDNPCLKCDNGIIVNNDNYDVDCKKCENGQVQNDDNDDPGECKKCTNGAVENDDGATCDDGDPCTKNDKCYNGVCSGDPVTSNEDPNCGG